LTAEGRPRYYRALMDEPKQVGLAIHADGKWVEQPVFY
jgi:hypothetical protein